MEEISEDWLEAHRLGVLLAYVALCLGLLQVVTCVCQENSDCDICGQFYLGYLLFHWVSAKPEWITAIATAFIGYFTLALKAATDKLWDAGERQLAHARESSARALRAYLSFSKPKLKVENGRASFVIRMMNFGSTPAYDVEYFCTPGISTIPLRNVYFFGPVTVTASGGITAEVKRSYFVLHQQQKATIYSRTIPIVEVMDDLTAGEKAVTLSWKITYNDAFGVRQYTQGIFFSTGEDFVRGKVKLHGEGSRAS